tara:strand:- start:809 stop:1417 length:609 start_codon:yes stop_codon:yes gene_type:complete
MLARYESNPKNNYFAPQFKVELWSDYIEKPIIDDVLEWVKENEDVYADHRWEHYNVFDWEYPTVKILKERIRRAVDEFCDRVGANKEDKLWIRGWIYPQKKGMTLERHFHSMHENSFLSGNICLTENPTSTDYDIPYLGLECVRNVRGMMVLFPSCLPHRVDELLDGERYTLAFDILTEDGMEYFNKRNKRDDDPLNLAILL